MDAMIVLAVLLGLFYLVAPIVSLVVTLNNKGITRRLLAENDMLRQRLDILERNASAPEKHRSLPVTAPPAAPTPEPVTPASVPSAEAEAPAAVDSIPAAPEAEASPGKTFDWERFIGVRLPVWLGAFALSLAGFFFVRYAIEAGLVTPAFRVFGALLAAFGFLGAGEWVRRRVQQDNGPAIAAALAAAGIATLYATAYLASVVYELVPTSAGFVAMGAVTVASVAVALAFGQTVALVGLLGGYVTPALIPSDNPSAPTLFAYLSVILGGMFVLIGRRAWWSIAPVALLGPLLWTFAWSTLPGFADDHLWATLFLFVVSATVLVASYPDWSRATMPVSAEATDWRRLQPGQVALLAVGVSSLGFLLLLIADTGSTFWPGTLTFSAAIVALAVVWPVALRDFPLAPLTAVALAVTQWQGDPAPAAIYIPLAGAIFGVAALDQFRRLVSPTYAAALSAFVTLFFFVATLAIAVGWSTALDNPHPWAFGALALGGVLLGLLRYFGPRIGDAPARDRVYAILASAVTAFVALVIVLEVDPLYFPAAAALEILGLAYVYHRVRLGALRIVAAILGAAYLLLILGAWQPAALAGQFTFDPQDFFAPALPDAPLVLLVLPGLALTLAGWLFRQGDADVLADSLEIGGLLAAVLGFCYLGGITGISTANSHTVVARIAIPSLVLAAAAIFAGQRWARTTLHRGGIVIAVAIAVGMAATVVLPLYAFWPRFRLEGTAVFNTALLSLGLPSLLLLVIGRWLRRDASQAIARTGIVISVAAVFYMFTLMLTLIRHSYHPADLQGLMSDAESYTYSAGMLLFGAALLGIGVAIRNLGARFLSFVFVLAATVKVFLFDAAELEGLWRVLSFFGMGLSFLAISWLYARFVFGLGRKDGGQGSAAP